MEGLATLKTDRVQVSPDHFGDHFPSRIEKMAYDSVKGSPNGAKSVKKQNLKIDAKNDTEKDAKMMPKGSQNDAKMDAKIDEKSMRFRNLRFLCFCREYNVKIFFLQEQAYQKSTTNPSKIDAKTRLGKMMPK